MVANKKTTDRLGVYLTEKQKKTMVQFADIVNTSASHLYGIAIEDWLIENVESFKKINREFPPIKREWLQERAQQEKLEVEFLEDESKEEKVGYPLRVGSTHKKLLDIFKDSNSYLIRVAVTNFLSALGIVEFVKQEKTEEENEEDDDEESSFNEERRGKIDGMPPKDTRPRISAKELGDNN